MSVLRSKRKIAKSEYEYSFAELYQFSLKQTSRIPQRRKKWLCTPIDTAMNKIYRGLMQISDSYFINGVERTKYAAQAALKNINRLNALEKPLMILWNVQSCETKTMAQWVTRIRWEVSLLNQMHDEENLDCTVSILDWQAINSAKFLQNMSELHRYVHGKVVNATNAYDSTEGSLLVDLVNDAFYEVIAANKKIPKTRAEYEQRRQHISNAIAHLKEMNRPMLFYFNLMQYSERVMKEWADMLSSEIKMLTALQKSDRKRFKNLC